MSMEMCLIQSVYLEEMYNHELHVNTLSKALVKLLCLDFHKGRISSPVGCECTALAASVCSEIY